MKARWGGLRYSAVLTPSGIHVVAYRRSGGGLQIVREARDLTHSRDAAEAIQRLANLLEAQGARHGRLALALGGFGSCHHRLTLPPGPRELLVPVVARELRRFYPALFEGGLEDPITDFLECGSPGDDGAAPQEIVAAALPRSLVRELRDSLKARQIALEHLTILPRVVEHLYDHFAVPGATTAALVMVPHDPLLGLFHEGELRLFSESIPGEGVTGALEAEVEAVGEQVERGALFIRQQFRGAAVERVLLAAEPRMRNALVGELEKRLEVPVERFSVHGDAPGSMAALGAALDAMSERPFNLLPAALRPRTASEAWVRRLAVATCLVLVAAGAWVARAAVRSADREETRVLTLARSLDRQSVALVPIRSVVGERRAHVQRAAVLEDLTADRERIPEVLWLIQNAPAGIRVDSLSLTSDGSGWQGILSGISRAGTSARATDAVDALYRDLARDRAAGSVVVRRLGAVDPGADDPDPSGVTLGFEISFALDAEHR